MKKLITLATVAAVGEVVLLAHDAHLHPTHDNRAVAMLLTAAIIIGLWTVLHTAWSDR